MHQSREKLQAGVERVKKSVATRLGGPSIGGECENMQKGVNGGDFEGALL